MILWKNYMKESATWYELHLTALLVVKDGHGGVDQMENRGLSNVELYLCSEAHGSVSVSSQNYVKYMYDNSLGLGKMGFH